ncbi:amidohydrolase 2 [Polyporus arcularius HHB13444]|uniref:6-methylsalicylate decarboxylase n=1 Tax=Polyporus arcularius HHB13444 TaxID=1314778 RepID=A0A5C3PP09_9APHY|nr:amidohydrolase 2 [Polyporus arcularius HHB13444]
MALGNTVAQAPRLKRIDVHHHNFPSNVGKLYEHSPLGYKLPEENLPWSLEKSLQAMDELGIDIAVLSLPDGWPIAGKANQRSAEICKQYPGRFGFFASLPDLRNTEDALTELAHALDDLHANGISLVSSYGYGAEAKYIGDDAFDPIWTELDRRGALVFLHGAQTPSSTPYPHPFLGIPVTEVPNETYKAAAHLVVTGKKRRYPNVKIILSHLGGSTVWLAPRVAVLSAYMGSSLTPEEIIEDFNTFYFDTALATNETTLTAAETFVGHDRVLFGTDYCAVTPSMAAWYKEQLEQFYADKPDRLQDIMSGNALKLMPELANMSS